MQNNKLCYFLFFYFIFVLGGCKNAPSSDSKIELSKQERFLDAFEFLTDVIVHDIFSPPVASRVYVYPTIAAHETIAIYNDSVQTYAGRLNELAPLAKPNSSIDSNPELAAIAAFLYTGKALVFSQDKVDAYIEQLKKQLEQSVDPKLLKESFSVGEAVAQHIITWSKGDNYAETRSSPKFTVTNDPGRWKPTPPAFMEGIEPNWREMRTMLLEDLEPYKPKPSITFSKEPESPFYQMVIEAKNVVEQADEEQRAIAAFWDCNPYVMNVTGHMMFASKKITPGGHWMGICALASRKAELNFAQTIEIHSRSAITIYDAFISCWDEKYRSNLIRPETVINEYIDQDWKPILQTPPFPEHTSGHSVVSTAAAVVLSDYFGDNFDYIDDVELKYGLPVRSFGSFREAASEAAISRLYGGIHYRPAIEDGEEQGERIGEYIVKELNKPN